MPNHSRAFVPVLWWLLAHIALGATIWLVSPGAETTWFHVGRWLTRVQDADSWKPIDLARASAASGSTDVYQDVFFGRREKFQYPLTAVTLVGWAGRPLLNAVTWLATAATALISGLLAHRAWRREEARTGRRAEPLISADLLVVVAVLTSYPAVKAYSLGQIQAVVTAACAALLLAWTQGQKAVAGVLAGAILLVKPAQAPVVLWALLRREWRFAGAAAATAIAGLVASLTQFPLAEQMAYLRVLSFIGRRGELFHANQSINGLVNRWVAGGGSLEWQPHAFAPPHASVAVLTTGAFVLLIAAALWLVPRESRGTTLDLSCMVIAATIASPVAWEHHYGVLAPVLAWAWPTVVSVRAAGRLTGILFGATTLVAANFFQVVNRFDGTWLNPLQSYLLFAALTLFALLVRTTRLQGA